MPYSSDLTKITLWDKLEDTTRYAGLFLAPAEGFGLWAKAFLILWGKKRPYYAVLANFRRFLVSSSNHGNFCSNLSNWRRKLREKNPKNLRKTQKNLLKKKKYKKNVKTPKNLEKSKKILKKFKKFNPIFLKIQNTQKKSIKTQKIQKLSKSVQKSKNLEKSKSFSKYNFF